MNRRLIALAAALAVFVVGRPMFAWNAEGHRIITRLALGGLPSDMPSWLGEREVVERIAYQSNEPDRWRGSRMLSLNHVNKPDHYLDIELLDEFGLTLRSLPRLRNEYLRAMIISKHLHPEKVSPYDAARDRDRSTEWPGMALHAISENYGKLQNSFNTIRILEQIDEPRRATQLAQARENAIHYMGLLSHFIGDLAQPLHTTKHFNGWVGDNPHDYTRSRDFHAYIDGGVIRHHRIDDQAVRPLVKDREVDTSDPWDDVVEYIETSFTFVEPLYRMERDGLLTSDPGRELITARLADASSMLRAMYVAAWRSAQPTPDQVAAWQRYNERPDLMGLDAQDE